MCRNIYIRRIRINFTKIDHIIDDEETLDRYEEVTEDSIAELRRSIGQAKKRQIVSAIFIDNKIDRLDKKVHTI